MPVRALTSTRRLRLAGALVAPLVGALLACGPAAADKIKHPTVMFNGLDKITGRIIAFEAAIDETVQFGSLQITPRVCYTRPATEAPQTTTFIEVDEVEAENKFKRVFAGWMFASSPGLHGIEHPVYDAWLTDCKGGTEVIPDAVAARIEEEEPPAPKPGTVPRPRRQQAAPSQRLPDLPEAVEVGPAPGAARPSPRAPAPAPTQRAEQAAPRRAPSQMFYPTNQAPPRPPANVPGGLY
ncbi:MAG TPA: DUF2155 domain-containing protein [Beijerinckiaceae bacterium]|jgi:hypothetical protein